MSKHSHIYRVKIAAVNWTIIEIHGLCFASVYNHWNRTWNILPGNVSNSTNYTPRSSRNKRRPVTVQFVLDRLSTNKKSWAKLCWSILSSCLNTMRPIQNGRHFPDDIFKWICLNENIWISINTSLKFVPMGPINNICTLVQVMAWRRPGDKPLSEPMMVRLPTHICVTRPQWVNRPNLNCKHLLWFCWYNW